MQINKFGTILFFQYPPDIGGSGESYKGTIKICFLNLIFSKFKLIYTYCFCPLLNMSISVGTGTKFIARKFLFFDTM